MIVRRILRVEGVVQGVGFRPFVAQLAARERLSGFVRNEGSFVRIDVEGPTGALDALRRGLETEGPPAARIDRVRTDEAPPLGRDRFVIDESAREGRPAMALPPDLATCAACLDEIHDPRARRFGYPFTNCTRCGPRFTIVTGLPYDRPRTTMSSFALCDECRAEYASPDDRRHHAQPIACAACGPHLRLLDRHGAIIAERALALDRAAEAIRRGAIASVKGLGGFQLVCDATREDIVLRLRARKRREAKPLAVMVRDLRAARRVAWLSAEEERALESAAAPIVLVRGRGGLARAVAPGLATVGLMLPTTPLHHLLLDALHAPLVCTSGNLHDDPIAVREDDALARLGAIADVFLVHDRPIARRADDGVVHVIDGRARTLRLGRGLGPRTLAIGGDRRPRLCLGGHLKSAPAALLGDEVVLWPHVGDLDAPLARAAFAETCADLRRFLELAPEEIVCDLHPDYASSLFAERAGVPIRRIPHHAAHIAACLAEHGHERALGIAWDGFGLGPDGSAWGGEALDVRGDSIARVAHLAPFALPGGDRAARDGRRALAGALLAADRADLADPDTARFLPLARSDRLAPRTSSAGRLFDAVAALLGVRARSSFEGQAAAELEALAEPGAPPYPFALRAGVIDWTPMIDPLARDRADVARAASRFHATLVAIIVAVTEAERASRVALSGGCFQNARLAEDSIAALRERGVEVLSPELAPPNDGGLALGQAWLASRRPLKARR